MDWYLPSEPGLILEYEDRFDGETIGEWQLEVLSLEKGPETQLVIRRTDDEEDTTTETYRLTPEGAWQGEKRVWNYPAEAREWDEADPQVGTIHCRQRFSEKPIQAAGQRFDKVLLVSCSSEGGQSTKAYAPQIGLLFARYLAGGTPGETILRTIKRTKR